MLKDGHQSINRDLYNHHKYSHYGMDDHKPYTVFWPWHIWGSHLKDIDGLKPATSETWHGNLYDSAHHWRLERNSLLWNWGFSVGIIHDMIYIYIWHNYMMFLMHCCIYIYIILHHFISYLVFVSIYVFRQKFWPWVKISKGSYHPSWPKNITWCFDCQMLLGMYIYIIYG